MLLDELNLFFFFFLINHASLIPCKDTHISPYQTNNMKIMPKAEAIATKVAIAKDLSDLSLLLFIPKNRGNRIASALVF